MSAIAEVGTTFEGWTADARSAKSTRIGVRVGHAMSGIAIAFLVVDVAGKLLQLRSYVEATTQLGYSADLCFGLGVVETICLGLYAIPRSAALGAVLLTGWLGGAIATHLRLGNPLATHTLFPIYVAILIWGGLYLRQAWLRAAIRRSWKEAR